MIDFKKWNDEFGGKAALEALENVKNNERTEVPDGEYVCKLDSMELGESRKGAPMLKAQFRIQEGTHKNQCLFLNQVMTPGFPTHKALEFMRDMAVWESDEIDFDGDFRAFNDLVLDFAEDAAGMTFEIEKSTDGDYTRLEVTSSYE